MKTKSIFAALVAATLVASLCAPLSAQGSEALAEASKRFFYFGLWPDRVVKYDPESDEVVKEMKLNNGLFFGLSLSHDKSKFYAITGQRAVVEVVDRLKMEVVDEHVFVENGFIVRVRSIRETPGGTHWYVNTNRVKTEKDHYKIEKPEWLYYNIAEKKIEKRLKELPRAIRSGARISPCGKKWHVFSRDITIVDPKTLKEEGKIELSKPLYTGMGPIRVRGDDFFDGKNPDMYRMMYTMRDPVKTSHSSAGIIDISIKEKKIVNMTEWGRDPGLWRIHMTADKKFGVGSGGGRGGRGDRSTRLITFDIENGKKVKELYEKFRPRRSLSGISPDGSKIYVGGPGNDFRIYNRDLEYLKTVTFDGDLYGSIRVLEG